MADWVAIRIEVEENGRSIRSVARDHKISDTAIRKEQKAGWPHANRDTRTANQCKPRTIPETYDLTKGLSAQERLFVAEWLVDHNAAKAAVRAGYSARSAKQLGSRLMSRKDVSDAIDAALEAQLKRIDVTADEIARRWWELANVDVNEIVQYRRIACKQCWREKKAPEDDTANPECPVCKGDGIGHIHINDSRTLRGAARRLYRGVQVGKDGIKVLMADQDAALVNIAKHLGMFVERKELTGKDGGPIQYQDHQAPLKDMTDDELFAELKRLGYEIGGGEDGEHPTNQE